MKFQKFEFFILFGLSIALSSQSYSQSYIFYEFSIFEFLEKREGSQNIYTIIILQLKYNFIRE